jgi:hypothetical protein
MPDPVQIALSQLVLWYDATRIQTWPAFLASIPDDAVLPSLTDFGRHFYTDRMTDSRHSAAEKIVRNLPGLELKKQKRVLRGVGLLEKVSGGYHLSADARALTKAYREMPHGQKWVRLLAALLLKREPRTRLLVYLLSKDGAYVQFDGDGWFTGSLRKATLQSPGMPEIRPFVDGKGGICTLREVLQEHAWWSLGDWRKHDLLSGFDSCHFTGQLGKQLSMHDMGLALHAACEVLLHAGILKAEGGFCVVDEAVGCSHFTLELAHDFGWNPVSTDTPSLVELLKALLPALKSDTDFIVASELRAALSTRGVANPDREMAELEHAGKVVIYAEDYGQSRHGAGLYGDPRKQLIKLRIVAEGM